jgi:hypothetical protein
VRPAATLHSPRPRRDAQTIDGATLNPGLYPIHPGNSNGNGQFLYCDSGLPIGAGFEGPPGAALTQITPNGGNWILKVSKLLGTDKLRRPGLHGRHLLPRLHRPVGEPELRPELDSQGETGESPRQGALPGT